MQVGEAQGFCMLSQGHVRVPETPARPALTDSVTDFACDGQMQAMELNGFLVIPKQRVRIAQAVARLSFDCPIAEFASQMQGAPVEEEN